MTDSPKNDLEFRAGLRRSAKQAGSPIDDDSVIELSHDAAGNPVVDSIKPVWRPLEKESEPIKSRWIKIWLVVVVCVVLAWLFLYWYFSNHQAPYAAPIGLIVVPLLGQPRNG